MGAAQRAQALVFLALALPIFIAMTGLAIDGALLLTTRRELQSVADGAARAGATRLDMERLRASGGGDVQLDRAAAYAAGIAYLDQSLTRRLTWESPPDAHVQVNRTRVRVVVDGTLRTAFLRIVGVERVPVGASAEADVQIGIREPASS